MTTDTTSTPLPYELAAARWIEFGWKSARNPVIDCTYQAVIAPLGIACDYVTCDTTPGLRRLPTFVEPRLVSVELSDAVRPLHPSPELLRYLRVHVRGDLTLHTEQLGPLPAALLSDADAFGDGAALQQVLQKARVTFALLLEAIFKRTCLPQSVPDSSRLLTEDPRALVLSFFQTLAG